MVLIRRRDTGSLPYPSLEIALLRFCLLVALLLPLPAAAQAPDAFCLSLRRLAEGAANGFDYIPQGGHVIPGSVFERRGVFQDQDGPARAAYIALLATSRERPSPIEARFRHVQAEIARCLPDAQAAPLQQVQRGAIATWTTSQARIALRRDDGDGFASDAELELAVASRW